MPAPATSEKMATTLAAPSRPACWARRIASALEPRPEPRTTIRMRVSAGPSDRAGGRDALYELCRAEPAQEGKEDDLGAGRLEGGPLTWVKRGERVVARLRVDVGPERLDLAGQALAAEDHDAVDRAELGQRVGARALVHDRAA